MRIGSEKYSHVKMCQKYNPYWEGNELYVLGITFPKDHKDIVELNYKIKIEEMTKPFLIWSKRVLTPFEKITIIKSLAFSNINRLVEALPNPTEKDIQDIQDIFCNY